MTKTHPQHDKEREVNGQTAILAERLAAAERERYEAQRRLAEILRDEAVAKRSGFWGRAAARLLKERDDLRAQLAEAQEYIDTVPPFAAAAGQRMADEINRLVLARVIDSRSPAADASLDWKDPDRTRIDEIDDLRAQLAEKNRDSERLDWIGINAEVIPSRSTHGLEERNCQRLRAAIDAAMHDDSAEPGLRPEDEYDAD